MYAFSATQIKENEGAQKNRATRVRGAYDRLTVVPAVPFFPAFLLLHWYGIMRAPMVGQHMVKKGIMSGQHGQRACIEHQRTIPNNKSRIKVTRDAIHKRTFSRGIFTSYERIYIQGLAYKVKRVARVQVDLIPGMKPKAYYIRTTSNLP